MQLYTRTSTYGFPVVVMRRVASFKTNYIRRWWETSLNINQNAVFGWFESRKANTFCLTISRKLSERLIWSEQSFSTRFSKFCFYRTKTKIITGNLTKIEQKKCPSKAKFRKSGLQFVKAIKGTSRKDRSSSRWFD